MSSNYYLHCIILKKCPFSEAAYSLIKSNDHIKTEYTFINYTDKEKYKTENINTFPQIYLKKINSNGSQLIGGYNEFKNLFNFFYNNYNNKLLEEFKKNNNIKWSNKTLLRLIELINTKKTN